MAHAEQRVDVWIAAAHPLELEALRSRLGPDLRASVGGRTIAASEVGVGLALAAAGTMRRLIETRPRATVLAGSCGVYPGRAAFRPGQLVIAERVQLLDAAELEGDAAWPPPLPRVLDTDRALSAALAAAGDEVLRGTLATTLGITTSDTLAARLASAGCVAENLEALGVALACQQQGVPFTAVLGVTNQVGAAGRAQWLEHRTLAARSTADLILRWIDAGARGF